MYGAIPILTAIPAGGEGISAPERLEGFGRMASRLPPPQFVSCPCIVRMEVQTIATVEGAQDRDLLFETFRYRKEEIGAEP